jgi:integrase
MAAYGSAGSAPKAAIRANDLPAACPATVALFTWLNTHFGTTQPHNAVAFPSLSRNSRGKTDRALSATALEAIAARWVGTSRFHALRHTFALAMVKAGANLFELSEALGHSNPATTGVYVQQLTQGNNPHLPQMAAIYAGRGSSQETG